MSISTSLGGILDNIGVALGSISEHVSQGQVDDLMALYGHLDMTRSYFEAHGEDGDVPSEGLCCTNRVRDSSRESSVLGANHEQTDTPRLQDPQLAGL